MDATTAAAAASFVGSCSSKTPVVSQGLFLKSSRVFLPGRQRKSVAYSTGWLESESHLKKGLFRGHGHGGVNLRSAAIKAAASNSVPTDPTDSSSLSVAPLQLESPVGQFLSQILANHPHLLPAAVEKQLEQLEIDLEKEKKKKKKKKEDPAIPSTELVLYRRIAELKDNERKRTLEEILYALVVQKFMEAEVGLVPAITLHSNPSSSQSSVDVWPAGEVDKLKAVHSSEAYEMIENHLHLILGQRLADSNSIAPPISKLRVGQLYAASVMYGYFLKRVDQRFQLEKNMKSLPSSKSYEEGGPQLSAGGGTTSPGGFGFGMKPTPLRAYVMSFDSETLQSYASIRSKEAFSIIEKHTEALFGKPDSVTVDASGNSSNKDELMKINIAGLKRLVLEAVTFGSFLWDVESHVDSRYRFVSVST